MAFWDRLAWHTKYKGLSHVLVDALNVNKMSLHDLLVDDGDKPRAVARAMMLLWIECVAEAECTVRDKTRAVALAAAAAAGASDVTSAAASAVEPLLPWLGGLFPACCDNAAAGSQAFECWVTRLDNAGALKPGVSTRLREVGASADSDDVVDVALAEVAEPGAERLDLRLAGLAVEDLPRRGRDDADQALAGELEAAEAARLHPG